MACCILISGIIGLVFALQARVLGRTRKTNVLTWRLERREEDK